MTLGSLFDGIGGFPLAGTRCGLTPLWASEIEPGPISITRRHFPEMEHLGDIAQIDGAAIRPADVVTFGSPCQDLSVAGKRAGLEGEKSGLFMEAARIIKEMREATHGIHPRFAVWENVPGAFSSNKGEDFRAVIKTIANIAEPGCAIPRPPRGRWNPAGAVVGDDWSIAWRVLDAQYWGVPQRRRRIFLVADFAGERAREILFEREGLRGNPAQSGAARQGVADSTARGIGGADSVCAEKECVTVGTLTAGGTGTRYPARGVEDADKLIVAHPPTTGTLCASGAGLNRTAGMASETDLCIVATFAGGRSAQSAGVSYSEEAAPTLKASGGSQVHNVLANAGNCLNPWDTQQNRVHTGEGVAPTLTGADGGGGRNPAGCVYAMQGYGDYAEAYATNTLRTALDVTTCAPVAAIDCRNFRESKELPGTLQAKGSGGYSHNYVNPILQRTTGTLTPGAHPGSYNGQDAHSDMLIPQSHTVRRLTPLECERLQGLPDGWTEYGHDGKAISDSARYRAIGNGLAEPCARYVLEGIAEAIQREKRERTQL